MKKLMIALAAVVSAVAVQAANVNWDLAMVVYDSQWNPAVGNVAISALTQSWSQDFDAAGAVNFSIPGTTSDIYAAGTEWSVKMTATLVGDDGVTTGNYVYDYVFNMVSLPSDEPSIMSALSAVADNISAAFDPDGIGTLPSIETALANGWSAAAVPEPTSGLLLLLGVAGLALKRKRA